MHPEIIKDGPGSCDVCGMPLVKAEDLGYLPATLEETELPLVIPASAPLITGKRAVVYVAVQGRPGVFEGREIVLGPRAGEDYLVIEGLSEGELVVTSGNFKIDSAIQLLAKPSMMDPDGVGGGGHQHVHGPKPTAPKPSAAEEALEAFETSPTFKKRLAAVVESYYAVQTALSQDNMQGAVDSSNSALKALQAVDLSLLEGEARGAWMEESQGIQVALEGIVLAESIDPAREAFDVLSKKLNHALRFFGVASDQPVYVVHCPMAFDFRGADWLQNSTEVRNPYFGSEMLECGSVKENLVVGDEGDHEH
jgi:Cu(I)/Ag(I) efflux system membrane fusion protein